MEKEFGQVFFEANSDKSIDTRTLHLDRHQVEHSVDQIFGCGNTIKINRFMQKLLDEFPSLRTGDRIKTYSFLNFALHDYYKCRRQTDRTVETVKNADQIAGITVKKLNQVQAVQGINRRLAKGLNVGNQAHELIEGRDMFGNMHSDKPFAFTEEITPTKPVWTCFT